MRFLPNQNIGLFMTINDSFLIITNHPSIHPSIHPMEAAWWSDQDPAGGNTRTSLQNVLQMRDRDACWRGCLMFVLGIAVSDVLDMARPPCVALPSCSNPSASIRSTSLGKQMLQSC
jgi:hypothetical protein